MKFPYRRYESGDEIEINDLYQAVTGRQRSVEQFAWQWLQTPGGKSEIWLIEAEDDDGRKKIIGHHGVMALPFTHMGESFRVGKTENTMVLPEYREKLIYPRFEMRFASQYEDRFHALFSTMGPDAAIRLRKVMGYESIYQWQTLYFGHDPYLSLKLISSRLLQKCNPAATLDDGCVLPESINAGRTEIKAFMHGDASTTFDFNGFWQDISRRFPFTPSRTAEYLSWRFWSNPHRRYVTLILNDDVLGVAVCTLSVDSTCLLSVDDIYCDNPISLPRFLEKVNEWAKKTYGFFILTFTTTTDTARFFGNSRFFVSDPWMHRLVRFIKRSTGKTALMPRKITDLGRQYQLSAKDAWYVTPMLFEGR